MAAQRLGRVVAPRELGLRQRRMHFLVANMVHENRGPALSAFELRDEVVQALRHPGGDVAPAERADRQRLVLMGVLMGVSHPAKDGAEPRRGKATDAE